VNNKTQEYIRAFFSGVMVDGITRKLEFSQEPEDFDDESGRIVVKMLMPDSSRDLQWEAPK
jgi:hypothetical protein